ncbi:MAG: sulfatase-like hydrolase/transferase [Chthoniobacterales bacterium]
MPKIYLRSKTIILAVCFAIASFIHDSSAEDRTDQMPNVVILFIDDLGYGDLGCFGNENAATPNIDKLAREGARLTMSYVTNPPCSPSRSSLLTGMYAQRFHKFGMARGLPIPSDHPTLAEFMRDAGYVTGQIGKWDLGSEGQGPHERGFMEVAKWAPGGQSYFCEKPDGTTVYRTELDGDYMVEFVERNKDKPFFLYFSPLAIHSPLKSTPDEYQSRIEDGNKWYDGAVAAVDDQVGKLLAALKANGLDKNTLILLTGDNGAGAGGSSAPYRGGKGKGTQFEGWVHTPSIAWWPGTIPAGQVFEGLTCTLDFYATAAAISGHQLPERCDGKDILPYLTGGKTGDVHEFLYWYNADPNDVSHRHLSAVRWGKWRLRLDQDTREWKLFDLHADPKEKNDLAAQNPEVVEKLALKHQAFDSTLPSLDSIPAYSDHWETPPEGWGWVFTEASP